MGQWDKRLEGSASVVASVAAVGTAAAVLLCASSAERIAFTAQPLGNVSFGPLASVNATTQVFCMVASGQLFEERDYRGPIYARSELDATLVRSWTVG